VFNNFQKELQPQITAKTVLGLLKNYKSCLIKLHYISNGVTICQFDRYVDFAISPAGDGFLIECSYLQCKCTCISLRDINTIIFDLVMSSTKFKSLRITKVIE